jgi:O-antigen/teichoic acid export membrane protein
MAKKTGYYFLAQSPLRVRLLSGIGAQGFGKAVITLQRLVEVPLLLQMWGVQLYGEWLLLAALPSYLVIGDGGFTGAAVRKMSILSAAGDREGAVRVFHSIQALLGVLALVVVTLSLVVVPLLPLSKWFSFQILDAETSTTIIQIFVISVMLNFYRGLISGSFWCDGKYPLGALLNNLTNLLIFCAFAIGVLLGKSVVFCTLTLLIGDGVGIVMMIIALRRAVPWLTFGFRHISLSEIKLLTIPAFAMLAFPLGNALNIQGLRIIVGAILGPASVVVFTALRTLARVIVQAREIINQIMQPEMSAAYGKNDSALFARLFMRSSQISIWLVAVLSFLMALFGERILQFWTAQQVAMDWVLYLTLLGVGWVNAIWYTAATVLLSINSHAKIAVAYLTIYGVLTFALAYVGLLIFGFLGLSISLLISEILMSLYTVPIVLRRTGTTWKKWLQTILQPPVFLLKILRKGK